MSFTREVTSKANFDKKAQEELVRKTIREIGYDDKELMFDGDTCKVDLSIDSKVGEVSIDSSVDSDPFKALDLIKAISFGFSKSRSSILLHEDEFLSVIDLKLYSGKSSNSLS